MSSSAPARRKASSIMTCAPMPTADRIVARRNRLVATPQKHCVQGVGQVRRGVDKRAVEVEHDGRVSKQALRQGGFQSRLRLTQGDGLGISHYSPGMARRELSRNGGSQRLSQRVRSRKGGRVASIEDLKERAALRALDFVDDGMALGLGSGSTSAKFVDALGRRVADGLKVLCVPTSEAIRAQAERLGIPLTTLDKLPQLDLTVDGADEIDSKLRLIKGGGGALLREKIVAASSNRMVVIADASKLVETLGRFPLPLEMARFGIAATKPMVEAMAGLAGCEGDILLRQEKGGEPFLTDQGNVILDCAFGRIPEPEVLAFALKRVPGLVEHGLFLGMADIVILAGDGGTKVIEADKESRA